MSIEQLTEQELMVELIIQTIHGYIRALDEQLPILNNPNLTNTQRTKVRNALERMHKRAVAAQASFLRDKEQPR